MKYSNTKQAQDILNLLLVQLEQYRNAKTEDEKDSVGNQMFYANPIVWMMYKSKAYQGTENDIRTIADLREHCSGHGICTKRFDFVSKTIKQICDKDLKSNVDFPDNMSIQDLYESSILDSLVLNKDFITSWEKYEFYKSKEEVAKWQNYTL